VTTMTDPQSRRRRPESSAPRARKRHPAAGARIVAAGVGVSTLLGIVAAMGVADALSAPEPSALDAAGPPMPATQPRVIVRIHRPAPTTPTTVAADDTTATTTPAPPEPVVLSARPDVRVVTAPAARSSSSSGTNQQATPAPAAPAPAPAATTSGSR